MKSIGNQLKNYKKSECKKFNNNALKKRKYLSNINNECRLKKNIRYIGKFMQKLKKILFRKTAKRKYVVKFKTREILKKTPNTPQEMLKSLSKKISQITLTLRNQKRPNAEEEDLDDTVINLKRLVLKNKRVMRYLKVHDPKFLENFKNRQKIKTIISFSGGELDITPKLSSRATR